MSPVLDLIIKEAQTLIDDEEVHIKMSQASNPCGDGQACKKVIEYLKGKM
ncbi:hypothetical protein MN086_07370 [Sulfurovum sp. XGS-02]|nr:hypothetical protein [Sulfurovum sp. XGS-02]UPT76873.1 hypothetical protein MN086_07370 [Sulfurovum sp. XGS-02]